MTVKEVKSQKTTNDNRAAVELAALIKSLRSTMRFPVYITEALRNTDVEALELTVRSYNCLKRAGFTTIGGLMESINESADLKQIRNLGDKSATEIMYKLYLYQYCALKPERQKRYLETVAKMNLLP